MKRMLKYIKKYWFAAILAPLFMIFEVGMDMVLANYMQKMIDEGITPLNLSNITKYGLIMIGVLLVGVICGIMSGVFANIASQNFANDLRKDLFSKIMSLSYDETDKFSTGSLITRVTNDVTTVQNMVAMLIRMFIRAFSMFVLGIVFTLRISVKFGYILLIALPIEILVMVIFMKKVFPYFSIIQKKIDKLNTVVHENLTGTRVVKAFSKEEYENNRFNDANNDHISINLKVNLLMSLITPLFMLIIYSCMLAIYKIGGSSMFDAYNNQTVPVIQLGQISQAITYITMICSSFISLGMTFTHIARASASVKRINEVMDCKLEINDGNITLDSIYETGTVEFKNVSFKYPGASGNVLENINLKINKGETIAIVGSTGCGKTSLINLISRFYDVSSGEVLVDGVNVKDYNLYDLRNKAAIVLQKAELFAGTIKENVLWGKQDATDKEVIQACKIAQAEEFILSTKDKYDEYVEEKGTSLSGGQRQRVSIARAIIKKPEILVFDDATSALDLITEANLYKAMKENINDVTRIVVTQRVATAKNANRIAVIDNNTIIACDSHENLLKNCKVYQDIYNSQLKKEGAL